MSRGITETDVWQAADSLLLDGARPTIERVRQKIGRGSPNTVSPLLDTWFLNLGARIKDARSFGPGAELPEHITKAATTLWKAAKDTAREEHTGATQAVRADAAAQVDAASEQTSLAIADARAARSEQAAADIRHALTLEKVSTLQQELAAKSARLDDTGAAMDNLKARLERQEQREAAALADLKRQLEFAIQRADAADRRVALELDAERTRRTKAERRVEAFEIQMERERQSAASEREASKARENAAERREADLSARLKDCTEQISVLRLQLSDVQLAGQEQGLELAASRAEVFTLRSTLGLLTASIVASKTAETIPKKSKTKLVRNSNTVRSR